MIVGTSVYEARLRLGGELARKIRGIPEAQAVDVVIPIPDSSRPSALELANTLGIKYREGFVKNRYVGRTFIMPGDEERRKSVRHKLNVIASEVRGRSILLVDDSIVRGTTSRQIIAMLREAGAEAVHVATTAPPLRHPCVYGIDMSTRREFIARDRTEAQIAELLGADSVTYQDLEDLVQSVREESPVPLEDTCHACFSGLYPTGDVDEAALREIEDERLRMDPPLLQVVEDDDPHRASQSPEGAFVELCPDLRARLPGEQADGLPAVAEGHHEQSRAPVLARLGMPDHRTVAVVDLGLLARGGHGDRVRLAGRLAAQLHYEAFDARVAGREAVVVDQVLPDRHRWPAPAHRLVDPLAVGLTGADLRAPARSRQQGRVGGRLDGRFSRGPGVGGRLYGRFWIRVSPAHGRSHPEACGLEVAARRLADS